MKYFVSLLLFFTVLLSTSAVLVEVPGYGTVKGDTSTSFHTKRPFYRFRSLHYAEEPTNQTRYLPPVPYTPEPGVIVDGTRSPPSCSQAMSITGGVEDCLIVNVFTPRLPGNASDPDTTYDNLLPVMFYIHGGGFLFGSVNTYGADKFMDKEIVLVEVQYRLGPFGFLSLNTDEIPGNAGIFDLIEGLRWTNKFIKYFGGDPNLVTVGGLSGGSISGVLLMMTPLAQGLFRHVIGQSGSILNPWTLDRDPVPRTLRIAELAGCPTEPYAVLVDCLRNIPADFITNAQNDYMIEENKKGGLGFGGSVPVIQVAGAQRVLEREPLDILTSGDYATEIPIMFGTNSQEGTVILGLFYQRYWEPNGLQNDSSYFETSAISDIIKSCGIEDPNGEFEAELISKYFYDAQLGDFQSMLPGLTDVCSVLFFKETAHQTAMIHSRFNPNTYWYSFEFLGRNSLWNAVYLPPRPPIPPGVCHADELIYLFSFPTYGNNETEAFLSKQMLDVWVNFATYGNPTPDGVEMMEGIPKFPATSEEEDTYMSINSEWSVRYNFSLTYTVTVDQMKPQHLPLP